MLCWAIWRCGAIASPITPTLRRPRGRLHPRARPARALVVVPRDVPRHRLPGAAARRRLRRRRARGARRRRRCPTARPAPPRSPSRVDDRRRHPVDVGHDVGPEGRRAHAPVAARRGRHDRRRARRCAPASRCCCRCRSRTSPGSRTACCCRSRRRSPRCSWTRGSPARALELVEREAHRGDDQHAGVHAHDDRSSRVRRDRPRRRCGCSRSAARASRPRWCAKARARVRLLVQAHVRLDRVPDAHDRAARRRPRTRRDHRRPADRRGRAAHRRSGDARRRRARHAGRAARPRARDVRRLPRRRARRRRVRRRRLVPHRRPRACTTASTSRSSTG